jgi:hypothetical protein
MPTERGGKDGKILPNRFPALRREWLKAQKAKGGIRVEGRYLQHTYKRIV